MTSTDRRELNSGVGHSTIVRTSHSVASLKVLLAAGNQCKGSRSPAIRWPCLISVPNSLGVSAHGLSGSPCVWLWKNYFAHCSMFLFCSQAIHAMFRLFINTCLLVQHNFKYSLSQNMFIIILSNQILGSKWPDSAEFPDYTKMVSHMFLKDRMWWKIPKLPCVETKKFPSGETLPCPTCNISKNSRHWGGGVMEF